MVGGLGGGRKGRKKGGVHLTILFFMTGGFSILGKGRVQRSKREVVLLTTHEMVGRKVAVRQELDSWLPRLQE